MLNICDLPVNHLRVANNGYDEYVVYLRICPSEADSKWLVLSESYCGCRSFGAREIGATKKFNSVKEAVTFIKSEYGRYGLSLLCDEELNKIDASKFLKLNTEHSRAAKS